MSGGSRGIGLAIALAAGRHGANVVILAKTDRPDPRLRGASLRQAIEIRRRDVEFLRQDAEQNDKYSLNLTREYPKYAGRPESFERNARLL